jgi:hypothetical protein
MPHKQEVTGIHRYHYSRIGSRAWAWWKDPFAMSLLLLMTAALVIVVVVLLLIRLSISAGKEGIQIFMGPFTDKPRNISWHEIKSLGIMDIHANGNLANIDSYLKGNGIAYVCQGRKAVIIERLNASPVVFSMKNAQAFRSALKKFYLPMRYQAVHIQ